MNPKIIVLSAILLVCSIFNQAMGQSFQVSGKVKDKATGAVLSDATVSIKGSSTRTKTNAQGEFTIKAVQNGAVLNISYIGMQTVTYKVNNANPISIELESTNNTLEDVVINVGYGTQKKSVVTGSISRVNAKDLANVPNGRVEQALQGRVAGVTIASNSGQPGTPSTILIRGVTTFGGGNNPLWVVDGIVVDAGGIGYLNQSDIESIEVLKDATSAAIYGTRAATGVIMVTTKKGKAGQLSVSYNGFYGISSSAKMLNLLNATQYATLLNEHENC